MPPASCLGSFISVLATAINRIESCWQNCILSLFPHRTSEELRVVVGSLLPVPSSRVIPGFKEQKGLTYLTRLLVKRSDGVRDPAEQADILEYFCAIRSW